MINSDKYTPIRNYGSKRDIFFLSVFLFSLGIGLLVRGIVLIINDKSTVAINLARQQPVIDNGWTELIFSMALLITGITLFIRRKELADKVEKVRKKSKKK